MNPLIAPRIWKSAKIAFAVTDRDLIIRELGGDYASVDNTLVHTVGLPILNAVPELVGNEQALADILAGKSPNFRLNLVNRDVGKGQVQYLLMEDLPIVEASGRISGIIHLVQDVTERGSLAQEAMQHRNELILLRDQIEAQNVALAAANTELQRQGEWRAQFISRAAQDITAINGSLELLLREKAGPLPASQRVELEMVRRNADRLLTLAYDMLDLMHLQSGTVELRLKPVDLRVLVEAVVAEKRPSFEAKKQVLHVDFSDKVSQALCDSARASEILTILLTNANQYTPEGGQISIRVQPHENPGLIQVSVQDTGAGIPLDEQPGIFGPWFRTKSARLLNEAGAGLGLSIARLLADLHGGSMWFESDPGQGSVFHVTFLAAL